MKKILACFAALFLVVMMSTTVFAESAVTRIKDIAKVQGVRSNQLMGYGLVVGLNGTGDSNKTLETLQSVANMLREYGVTINKADLKTKNVAAVMVTATLPPFVREGDNIDITVSSMGDAKSLAGGTLLQTPLRAANGTVLWLRADFPQARAAARSRRTSRRSARHQAAPSWSAASRMMTSARTVRSRSL